MNITSSTQKRNVLNAVNYLSLSVMTAKTIECMNVQNVEYLNRNKLEEALKRKHGKAKP